MNRINLLSSASNVAFAAPTESGNDTKEIGVTSSNAILSRVYDLMTELKTDKDELDAAGETVPSLRNMLDNLALGKIEESRAPLAVLAKMQELYGERIEEFPEPDSKQGETGNRPYDNGKIPQVVDGENKERNGNFYTEFAERFSPATTSRVEQLREAVKPNGDLAKIKDADIKAHLEPRDNRWLVAEKKMWEGRATSIRGYLKRSMKLKFAMERIPQEFVDVGLDVLTYDVTHDGETITKLLRTNVPIVLYKVKTRATEGGKATQVKDDEGNAVPVAGTDISLNVSQVIKLGDRDTIKAAKKAGGTYDTLVKSLRRDTSGGQDKAGKDGGGDIAVTKSDQCLGAMVAINSYLIEDTNIATVMARFDRKRKDSDQMVKIFGDFYHNLGGIYGQIKGRYEKMLAKAAQEEPEEMKKAS